ncbi:MAG: hypothetical protein GY789_09375 [Hyphomicrobiales bacterium]|nr:hypothetical protein [Hyphomicrobiales bacterium]MCP4998626.1 hypothetical protein [Hyphomicrobiales bacterium]
MGWTMAGPSVVLTYLAVALDLPIVVAGLLVTARHVASFGTDIFSSGFAASTQNRKRAIAVVDFIVGCSYVLVVAVAVFGSTATIIAGFGVAVIVGSAAKEFKVFLMTDLLGDNLQADGRRKMHYTQMMIAGVGAIVLTGLAHWHLHENPPIDHYSAVISIAIACFFASALLMLVFHDDQSPIPAEYDRGSRPKSGSVLQTFFPDAKKLFAESWFRKFVFLRLMVVSAGLSVPFFSLVTALAHNSTSQVLAALIISSAAATLVASRIWLGLNEYSNRLVIVLGASLVAATGIVLLFEYNFRLANSIYLHAIVLFVVTVALKGLTSAMTLHFLQIAPKAQRISAQAVSKSLGRVFIIGLSTLLAALAHVQAIDWIIVLITAIGVATAVTSHTTMTDPDNAAQVRA